MHSVPRSPEPSFFVQLRSNYKDWLELGVPDRRRVRQELKIDFNGMCAYCEQPCVPTARPRASRHEESVDHYKPRYRCTNLWLDWLNLVYSCWRCNHAKDNKWPELSDGTNQSLVAANPRYTAVSGYLSPNEIAGQRTARDCIDFNHSTGEIIPNDQMGTVEWSTAKRTIVDIDLNDISIGQNDPTRLPSRRRVRLGLLVDSIGQLDSMDEKVAVMRSFAQPDKPFSTFIRTWISHRFPEVFQSA